MHICMFLEIYTLIVKELTENNKKKLFVFSGTMKHCFSWTAVS